MEYKTKSYIDYHHTKCLSMLYTYFYDVIHSTTYTEYSNQCRVAIASLKISGLLSHMISMKPRYIQMNKNARCRNRHWNICNIIANNVIQISTIALIVS